MNNENNGELTITITHEGTDYTATIEGTEVTISAGGVWAGKGRWDAATGTIRACAAVLGGSQDAADEIYDALDEALAAAS